MGRQHHSVVSVRKIHVTRRSSWRLESAFSAQSVCRWPERPGDSGVGGHASCAAVGDITPCAGPPQVSAAALHADCQSPHRRIHAADNPRRVSSWWISMQGLLSGCCAGQAWPQTRQVAPSCPHPRLGLMVWSPRRLPEVAGAGTPLRTGVCRPASRAGNESGSVTEDAPVLAVSSACAAWTAGKAPVCVRGQAQLTSSRNAAQKWPC